MVTEIYQQFDETTILQVVQHNQRGVAQPGSAPALGARQAGGRFRRNAVASRLIDRRGAKVQTRLSHPFCIRSCTQHCTLGDLTPS